MKRTILELVQDTSSAVDGADVNSISDSEETLQIANDLRIVYYDLIGRKDWSFLRKLRTLDSVSNSSYPSHLKIPDNTSRVDYIKYNKRESVVGKNKFQDIIFKYPDDFLEEVNSRDSTAANMQVVTDFSGARITIKNDTHPTYFTSLDDKYIIMDAFKSTIDTTLTGANTQVMLYIAPTWTLDDNFIPELPSEMFPLLLAESISYAQARKDDVLLQKSEQTATRHQRHLSQSAGNIGVGIRRPNYGRTSPKGFNTHKSPLFGR